MNRSLEQQLVETKISPCPEFERGVPDGSSMHKSKFLVQRNTGRVRDINAADHDVILVFLGRFDQLLQEPRANPFASMIFVYVDRMLHRVLIGRPRPKRSVACEPEEVAERIHSSDDRKSPVLLGFEPPGHTFTCSRLVVIERCRIHDGFIEDIEDRARMGFVSTHDEIHDMSPIAGMQQIAPVVVRTG
jgi:hypothetical protein